MLRTCCMEAVQLNQLTARLRRQFPRLNDVLELCDWVEKQSRAAVVTTRTWCLHRAPRAMARGKQRQQQCESIARG
jgi:hypothetical protein